jgi:hypothetical protein
MWRTILRPIRQARWLVALMLSLAIASLATDLAAAAEPFDASGTTVSTGSTQSNIRSLPAAPGCECRVTLFDDTEQVIVSGTFSGTGVVELSCVVPSSTLQGRCHGTETFTGTVAGKSGTARFEEATFFDLTTGASHGTFTVVGGTGGLTSLRGHGTFEGNSYTGRLVFASSA